MTTLVGALIIVLACAASASAECAWVLYFKTGVRIDQKPLRPRTRRLYRALMKPPREHLGNVRLSALSPLDLERYKRDCTAPGPERRTTGQTTTNRHLALLSAVIKRRKAWGLSTRPTTPAAR